MSSILDVYSQLSIGSPQALTADFIGRGNLWINNSYDASVNRLARTIISEAILKTAPSQLSVLGYDGDLSGVFAPFAALSAGESKILEFVNDEKQLLEQRGDVETADSQADSLDSKTADSQADSSDREADSSTVPYEKEAA